jgi:hypothetical protein
MDALSIEALVATLPEARRDTVDVLRRIVRRAQPEPIEGVPPGGGQIG